MKTHSGNVVPLALALTALGFNLSVIQPARAFIFTTTGPLNTARWFQTETLLNNGKVLVAGGYDLSGVAVASAELYDPAAGTWTVTGPMHTARVDYTATLLPNGKVLVAGGVDSSDNILSSAELYDPISGSWTLTGNLNTAREGQTATLLYNGKVLVTGGIDNSGSSTPNSELYNPATGLWGVWMGNHLITARYDHTATLLPDGRVLVAGGYNTSSGILDSAELFTPSSSGSGGTWSAASNMSTPRNAPTATLLPNGQVLVAGGFYGTFLSSSELYTPDSGAGTWTGTGLLKVPRCANTATLLPNGQVLVTGGYGPLASTELYNPASGLWTTNGLLLNARYSHTATLLANGQVLVVGGYEDGVGPLASAELCVPTNSTWTVTSSLNTARDGHTATLLPDGTVLVAGGRDYSGAITTTAEIYDPTAEFWMPINPLNTAHLGNTATLLAEGRVLVVEGTNSSGYLSHHYAVERYDPDAGTWTSPIASCTSCHNPPPPFSFTSPAGHLHVKRALHTATLLRNGKVLVTGGQTSNGTTNIAELYDPTSGTWSLPRNCGDCHHPPSSATPWSSPAGHLHSPRYGHTATLLTNGTVLVVGGNNDRNNFVFDDEPGGPDVEVNVELYDPVMGTWAPPRPCEDCHGAPGGLWTYGGPGHLFPSQIRSGHTATLLPNGKVLVAGGYYGGARADAMLYDPVIRIWTTTGAMAIPRQGHKATLLPNGKVLVTGGYNSGGTVNSAELYDPASGTWMLTTALNTGRALHTATLLADGTVLVAGGYNDNSGYLASSELYNVNLGFSTSWQPQINNLVPAFDLGDSLTLGGSGFRGVSGGSCGMTSFDSPGNVPVVQLLSLANEQTLYLLPDPGTNWSDTSYTSTRVSGMPPGYALVTMFVNGIPSTPGSMFPMLSDDLPSQGNILHINVPVPTLSLAGAMTLQNGSFQLAFTNTVGAFFGMMTTTNLSLPMTNWTLLDGVTEISLGQFQFGDPQTAGDKQRFYRLFSP